VKLWGKRSCSSLPVLTEAGPRSGRLCCFERSRWVSFTSAFSRRGGSEF